MIQPAKLDLLLINPANQKQIYQSLSTSMTAIENPVWAGLMMAFIQHKGLSVDILDATALNLTPDEVAAQVVEINPTLTAIVVYGHQPSASTQVMPGARAICNTIKQYAPNQKVILVGGHVAALPRQSLKEESTDFVASGEGLFTLADLTKALKAGDTTYSKVPDLWYWEGHKPAFTTPAALLNGLDTEMPMIPWDMFPMDKYRAHNWHCFDDLQRQPYASIYTTLGCPYHCTFCCIQAPFKSGEQASGIRDKVNSYRFWSPEKVVDQIGYLVEHYGVRNLKIADEMFVLNKRHVLGICDLIIERGYDLNIWAYTRVDTIKEGMLPKLKAAGFNWLAFGFESANERVRNDAQKGVAQEDIVRIVEKVRSEGINIIGNYIFGLPEDDMTTMQETLDLAIELNCEFANFYCAMAYPGSELYRLALNERWPLPQSWSGYSQHAVDTLPLPTRYLSASEVLRFRDHAFQTYFSHPHYLSMIRERFGEETASHIRRMTSVKLKRRFA